MTVRWRLTRMLSEESTSSSRSVRQNPSRGFYRVYTYDLTQEEDETDWIWSLCREERLALVILNIGGAWNRLLTNRELEKAGRVFQLFVDADMEMILRIVYDTEGKGLVHEPKERSLIAEHMHQLGVVIRQFSEFFFTIQGLFIGSWGEMHDSAFLKKQDLQFLYQTLRESVGEQLRIAVRKPQYQRMLSDANGQITTGLYDDAILGSENDMGTFGWLDDTADMDIMWTPSLELEFIAAQDGYYGCGGEILSGALEHPVTEVFQRLSNMRVTYLNHVHEPALWEQWDQNKVPGTTQTVSSYIGDHLGYRYLVTNICLQETPELYKTCNIDPVVKQQVIMQVHNTGFAPAVDVLMIELYMTDENQQVQYHKIQHFLPQGENVLFEFDSKMKKQTLALWLRLFRKRDNRTVYFANLYDRKCSNISCAEALFVGTLERVIEPSS